MEARMDLYRPLLVVRSQSGKRMAPWCDTTVELDMTTLVWTRGERFPLIRLAEVLKCPRCQKRDVRVFFGVPNEPVAEKKRIEL
jgi:hypothetical protein